VQLRLCKVLRGALHRHSRVAPTRGTAETLQSSALGCGGGLPHSLGLFSSPARCACRRAPSAGPLLRGLRVLHAGWARLGLCVSTRPKGRVASTGRGRGRAASGSEGHIRPVRRGDTEHAATDKQAAASRAYAERRERHLASPRR
jgi:hypothetical protein